MIGDNVASSSTKQPERMLPQFPVNVMYDSVLGVLRLREPLGVYRYTICVSKASRQYVCVLLIY